MDPQIEAELTEKLGHAAPYEPAELLKVRMLVVARLATTEGMDLLRGLRNLVIRDSVLDARPLAAMARLRGFEAQHCILENFEALNALSTVSEIVIEFANLSDVTPLLALPLQRLELIACDLDESSVHLLEDQARDRRHWPEMKQPPKWDPPEILELNRQFGERNWPLRCILWDPAERRVQLQTIGRHELGPEFWSGRTRPIGDIQAALADAGFDWRQLLRAPPQRALSAEMEAAIDRLTRRKTFRIDDHVDEGTASDARGWILGSPLDANDRACLLRFVDRFPGVTFFRAHPSWHDHEEEASGVHLPPWFRMVRETFIGPTTDWWYRFGLFEADTGVDLRNSAFSVEARGAVSEEERKRYFERAQFFPVGQWDQVMLGIDLRDPTDTSIYTYDEESSFAETWDGAPSCAVAFRSLTQLLDSTVALVRFDQGSETILQARDTLVGADLRGADLRGRDLSGRWLLYADLRDADLRGADLRDADLRHAQVEGASLEGARLDGAVFDGEHDGHGR